MNTFSAGAPLKRSQAMNCLLVNQFATPGLGSLMGRRLLEGMGQLALAIAGFILVTAWFVEFGLEAYHSFNGSPAEPGRYPWSGKVGAILFIAAWAWSWVTSLSLLRGAKQDEPAPPVVSAPPKPPLLH